MSRAVGARGSRSLAIGTLVLAGCVASTPVLPEPQGPRPLIWHAQRSDLPGTAYLLGSVHVRKEATHPFEAEMAEVLRASDVLVLEANVDAGLLVTLPLVLWHGFTLTDPLPAKLEPEFRAALRARLRDLGQSPRACDFMRPWLALLSLSAFELERQGYSEEHGTETILRAWAEEQDKALRYLETIDEQIRIFADLEEELQLALLRETLTSTASTLTEADPLYRAYADGDAERLADLVYAASTSHPEFQAVLFDDRNRRFAESVEAFLREDETFLVVMGAGHVVGPTGVPRLLRERGFEVHRWTPEPSHQAAAGGL